MTKILCTQLPWFDLVVPRTQGISYVDPTAYLPTMAVVFLQIFQLNGWQNQSSVKCNLAHAVPQLLQPHIQAL